jgi:ribonuclease PH
VRSWQATAPVKAKKSRTSSQNSELQMGSDTNTCTNTSVPFFPFQINGFGPDVQHFIESLTATMTPRIRSKKMQRSDGRAANELRPVELVLDIQRYAEGSVLIKVGNTHVLCSVTIEEGVPSWLKGRGQGWLTAEYSLLPRATHSRTRRERTGAGGRTQEIQRLIGRSLRAALDFKQLGERTITVDCDVLQADGGTRTAAITGGYVALEYAISRLLQDATLTASPIITQIAAVSVGIVQGVPLLDLTYVEDSAADVDCNIVQTGSGAFIEVQGTAEHQSYTRDQLNSLLDLADVGVRELMQKQHAALEHVRQ